MQVAAYQLILDRKIGQYTLPEGAFVVALGNREDDDGVYIQLAGPLADRFEIHYIEPNFEDWKNDFALKYNVHPYVIRYLTFKPSALHNQQAEEGNMLFATPRSWERVSDILHVDSDVNNPVIRYKIIGNVGEVEGTQFVEYCRSHMDMVTADDFLAGQASAPEAPEEISILVSSLVNKVSFLESLNAEALTEEQRAMAEKVIRALFRMPHAEHTIVGLKGMLDINRNAVKQIFLQMDDPRIQRFLKSNGYALGLEDTDRGQKKRWLSMWE